MFGLMRRLSLAVPLTLAVAVPYAMMSESTRSVRESLKSSFGSWFTAAETKSVPNGTGDPQLGPIRAMDGRRGYRFRPAEGREHSAGGPGRSASL